MFGSRKTRAEQSARADAAEAAAPKYEIVHAKTGRVLEEVTGTPHAMLAQDTWHKCWKFSGGPRTVMRMKPTGIPAARDTVDALVLDTIPSGQHADYVRALRLIITQRVPLEDLRWLAAGGLPKTTTTGKTP